MANHEIPLVTEAQAFDVARFTEQLLKRVNEMDHLYKAVVE